MLISRRDGIVCFTPEEVATIGEASRVGNIARAESWNSLTVVTSKSHVFRARYIFEHCLGADIDVNLVYSDPDLSAGQWAWNIAYENAAFVNAVLQTGFAAELVDLLQLVRYMPQNQLAPSSL